MKRALDFSLRCYRFCFGMARAGVMSVATHWALAIFSLVTAFGVWMAVQDVENPLATGLVPQDGAIQVEAVNVPDGYLVEDLPSVTVEVRARRNRLTQLSAADFKATVDVQDAPTNGDPVSLPVRVVANDGGIQVRRVREPLVQLRLIRAGEKDVQVTLRRTVPLPTGYEETGVEIQPAFVTVRGPQDRVDQVATVELDVNLSGVRDRETFAGTLVARSQSGNPLTVQLSPSRVSATVNVQPTILSRRVDLAPVVVGDPAPGYEVRGIYVEPNEAIVTGAKLVIDGLRPPARAGPERVPSLNIERLDITNAKTSQTVTRRIEAPPNTSVQPQTVVVRVEIGPQEVSVTRIAGPTFENVPAGLQVAPGTLSVAVVITGPLEQLNALKPEDVKAVVNLAGGVPGAAQYPVRVTVPSGLRAESAPATVTLLGGTLP